MVGNSQGEQLKGGRVMKCGHCGSPLEPLNAPDAASGETWAHPVAQCPWSEWEGLTTAQVATIGRAQSPDQKHLTEDEMDAAREADFQQGLAELEARFMREKDAEE